jgi:hypothetical protein
MKRVIKNNLNLSNKWGVPLYSRDLYVLEVDQVDCAPEDAIQPSNFVSAAKPCKKSTTEKKVSVEETEIIEESIPRFDKSSLEDRFEKQLSLDAQRFSSKRLAVQAARKAGYSVENVLRDENDSRKWQIISR